MVSSDSQLAVVLFVLDHSAGGACAVMSAGALLFDTGFVSTYGGDTVLSAMTMLHDTLCALDENVDLSTLVLRVPTAQEFDMFQQLALEKDLRHSPPAQAH